MPCKICRKLSKTKRTGPNSECLCNTKENESFPSEMIFWKQIYSSQNFPTHSKYSRGDKGAEGAEEDEGDDWAGWGGWGGWGG